MEQNDIYRDTKYTRRCANLRTGIPDPWAEYLAFRAVKLSGRRIHAEEQLMWSDHIQLTDKLWNTWGLYVGQGIPDPWKNWPKSLMWQGSGGDEKRHGKTMKAIEGNARANEFPCEHTCRCSWAHEVNVGGDEKIHGKGLKAIEGNASATEFPCEHTCRCSWAHKANVGGTEKIHGKGLKAIEVNASATELPCEHTCRCSWVQHGRRQVRNELPYTCSCSRTDESRENYEHPSGTCPCCEQTPVMKAEQPPYPYLCSKQEPVKKTETPPCPCSCSTQKRMKKTEKEPCPCPCSKQEPVKKAEKQPCPCPCFKQEPVKKKENPPCPCSCSTQKRMKKTEKQPRPCPCSKQEPVKKAEKQLCLCPCSKQEPVKKTENPPCICPYSKQELIKKTEQPPCPCPYSKQEPVKKEETPPCTCPCSKQEPVKKTEKPPRSYPCSKENPLKNTEQPPCCCPCSKHEPAKKADKPPCPYPCSKQQRVYKTEKLPCPCSCPKQEPVKKAEKPHHPYSCSKEESTQHKEKQPSPCRCVKQEPVKKTVNLPCRCPSRKEESSQFKEKQSCPFPYQEKPKQHKGKPPYSCPYSEQEPANKTEKLPCLCPCSKQEPAQKTEKLPSLCPCYKQELLEKSEKPPLSYPCSKEESRQYKEKQPGPCPCVKQAPVKKAETLPCPCQCPKQGSRQYKENQPCSCPCPKENLRKYKEKQPCSCPCLKNGQTFKEAIPPYTCACSKQEPVKKPEKLRYPCPCLKREENVKEEKSPCSCQCSKQESTMEAEESPPPSPIPAQEPTMAAEESTPASSTPAQEPTMAAEESTPDSSTPTQEPTMVAEKSTPDSSTPTEEPAVEAEESTPASPTSKQEPTMEAAESTPTSPTPKEEPKRESGKSPCSCICIKPEPTKKADVSPCPCICCKQGSTKEAEEPSFACICCKQRPAKKEKVPPCPCICPKLEPTMEVNEAPSPCPCTEQEPKRNEEKSISPSTEQETIQKEEAPPCTCVCPCPKKEEQQVKRKCICCLCRKIKCSKLQSHCPSKGTKQTGKKRDWCCCTNNNAKQEEPYTKKESNKVQEQINNKNEDISSCTCIKSEARERRRQSRNEQLNNERSTDSPQKINEKPKKSFCERFCQRHKKSPEKAQDQPGEKSTDCKCVLNRWLDHMASCNERALIERQRRIDRLRGVGNTGTRHKQGIKSRSNSYCNCVCHLEGSSTSNLLRCPLCSCPYSSSTNKRVSDLYHNCTCPHKRKDASIMICNCSDECNCPHKQVQSLQPTCTCSDECNCPHKLVQSLQPTCTCSDECNCPHKQVKYSKPLCTCSAECKYPYKKVNSLEPLCTCSDKCNCPHKQVESFKPMCSCADECNCPHKQVKSLQRACTCSDECNCPHKQVKYSKPLCTSSAECKYPSTKGKSLESVCTCSDKCKCPHKQVKSFKPICSCSEECKCRHKQVKSLEPICSCSYECKCPHKHVKSLKHASKCPDECICAHEYTQSAKATCNCSCICKSPCNQHQSPEPKCMGKLFVKELSSEPQTDKGHTFSLLETQSHSLEEPPNEFKQENKTSPTQHNSNGTDASTKNKTRRVSYSLKAPIVMYTKEDPENTIQEEEIPFGSTVDKAPRKAKTRKVNRQRGLPEESDSGIWADVSSTSRGDLLDYPVTSKTFLKRTKNPRKFTDETLGGNASPTLGDQSSSDSEVNDSKREPFPLPEKSIIHRKIKIRHGRRHSSPTNLTRTHSAEHMGISSISHSSIKERDESNMVPDLNPNGTSKPCKKKRHSLDHGSGSITSSDVPASYSLKIDLDTQPIEENEVDYKLNNKAEQNTCTVVLRNTEPLQTTTKVRKQSMSQEKKIKPEVLSPARKQLNTVEVCGNAAYDPEDRSTQKSLGCYCKQMGKTVKPNMASSETQTSKDVYDDSVKRNTKIPFPTSTQNPRELFSVVEEQDTNAISSGSHISSSNKGVHSDIDEDLMESNNHIKKNPCVQKKLKSHVKEVINITKISKNSSNKQTSKLQTIHHVKKSSRSSSSETSANQETPGKGTLFPPATRPNRISSVKTPPPPIPCHYKIANKVPPTPIPSHYISTKTPRRASITPTEPPTASRHGPQTSTKRHASQTKSPLPTATRNACSTRNTTPIEPPTAARQAPHTIAPSPPRTHHATQTISPPSNTLDCPSTNISSSSTSQSKRGEIETRRCQNIKLGPTKATRKNDIRKYYSSKSPKTSHQNRRDCGCVNSECFSTNDMNRNKQLVNDNMTRGGNIREEEQRSKYWNENAIYSTHYSGCDDSEAVARPSNESNRLPVTVISKKYCTNNSPLIHNIKDKTDLMNEPTSGNEYMPSIAYVKCPSGREFSSGESTGRENDFDHLSDFDDLTEQMLDRDNEANKESSRDTEKDNVVSDNNTNIYDYEEGFEVNEDVCKENDAMLRNNDPENPLRFKQSIHPNQENIGLEENEVLGVIESNDKLSRQHQSFNDDGEDGVLDEQPIEDDLKNSDDADEYQSNRITQCPKLESIEEVELEEVSDENTTHPASKGSNTEPKMKHFYVDPFELIGEDSSKPLPVTTKPTTTSKSGKSFYVDPTKLIINEDEENESCICPSNVSVTVCKKLQPAVNPTPVRSRNSRQVSGGEVGIRTSCERYIYTNLVHAPTSDKSGFKRVSGGTNNNTRDINDGNYIKKNNCDFDSCNVNNINDISLDNLIDDIETLTRQPRSAAQRYMQPSDINAKSKKKSVRNNEDTNSDTKLTETIQYDQFTKLIAEENDTSGNQCKLDKPAGFSNFEEDVNVDKPVFENSSGITNDLPYRNKLPLPKTKTFWENSNDTFSNKIGLGLPPTEPAQQKFSNNVLLTKSALADFSKNVPQTKSALSNKPDKKYEWDKTMYHPLLADRQSSIFKQRVSFTSEPIGTDCPTSLDEDVRALSLQPRYGSYSTEEERTQVTKPTKLRSKRKRPENYDVSESSEDKGSNGNSESSVEELLINTTSYSQEPTTKPNFDK